MVLLHVIINLIIVRVRYASFIHRMVLLTIIIFVVFFIMCVTIPINNMRRSTKVVAPSMAFRLFLTNVIPYIMDTLFTNGNCRLSENIIVMMPSLRMVKIRSREHPICVSIYASIKRPHIRQPVVISRSHSRFRHLLIHVRKTMKAIRFYVKFRKRVAHLRISTNARDSYAIH